MPNRNLHCLIVVLALAACDSTHQLTISVIGHGTASVAGPTPTHVFGVFPICGADRCRDIICGDPETEGPVTVTGPVVCSADYKTDDEVYVAARPASGFPPALLPLNFLSGECHGRMNSDKHCTVDFHYFRVTINKPSGYTVTGPTTSPFSANPTLTCGDAQCTDWVRAGATVKYTATPPGSWSGDCDANGNVTVDVDKSCTLARTGGTSDGGTGDGGSVDMGGCAGCPPGQCVNGRCSCTTVSCGGTLCCCGPEQLCGGSSCGTCTRLPN